MEGPLLTLQFCPDPLTNMAASQFLFLIDQLQCLKWTVAQYLIRATKSCSKLGSHWPNKKRLGDCLLDR
jgi:hypothetical protein